MAPKSHNLNQLFGEGAEAAARGIGQKARSPQVDGDFALSHPKVNRKTLETAQAAVSDTAEVVSDKIGEVGNWQTYLGIGALSLVPGLVGSVGGGINRVGGWIGLNSVANAGNTLKESSKAFGEMTVSDVGSKLPAGVTTRIKGASEAIANRAANLAGQGDNGGLGAWLSKRAAKKAAATHAKAVAGAQKALGIIGTDGASTDGSVETVRKLLHDIASSKNAEELGGMASRLKEAEEDVAKLLKRPGAVKQGTWFAGRKLNKVVTTAANAVSHHADHIGFQNMAEGARAIPGRIANANLMHSVQTGAYIALDVAFVAKNALDFAHSLEVGKRMLAAMNGKAANTVSTYEFMTSGNPLIAETRNAMIKQAGVGLTTQLVALGMTVANAARNISMLKFMGVQAAGGLIGAALGGDAITPMYHMMEKAEANGQAIPAEFLADFLVAARKDFRARGTTGEIMAQKIAAQYVNEGKKLSDIMHEMGNGKLSERVAAIQSAGDTLAKPAKALETPVAATPEISMVDRLNGAKSARPEVGEGEWTGAAGKLAKQENPSLAGRVHP